MVKVAKFGGSSLADANQFRKVFGIIKSDDDRKYVVPSAPGKRFSEDTKVTDLLYLCYEAASSGKAYKTELSNIRDRYDTIIRELGLTLNLESEFAAIAQGFVNKAGADYAASRGEYLNGLILSEYLGFEFIDAAEVIIFGEDGQFDAVMTEELIKHRLSESEYAVIPGFYGSMPDGTIKTFSRGGSDITGSVIAGAIRADLYENWTDVSGILVADPRVVENPEVAHLITYKELRELSYMGATVLHEDAVFPVRRLGIPINVRNTNQPQDEGTMIVDQTDAISDYYITGIAGKVGYSVVTIEKDRMNSEIGIARKILGIFEELGISFEYMPSGIDTMSVVVKQDELKKKQDQLIHTLYSSIEPASIEVEEELALLAVVGRGMKAVKGIASRIFHALADADVNIKMIDQGSSERNVIVGLCEADYVRATQAIYREFVKE